MDTLVPPQLIHPIIGRRDVLTACIIRTAASDRRTRDVLVGLLVLGASEVDDCIVRVD